MKKRKRSPALNLLTILVLFALIIYYFYNSASDGDAQPFNPDGSLMRVHYIDVGQGDSGFVEFPNGECMLIDAGEREYGDTVADYISDLGYSRVDYLVATHPHSDHIGGMRTVVESFDIGEVFMPKVSHNTRTYEDLLTVINGKVGSVTSARAGLSVTAGEVTVEFVAPVNDDYDNLNDWSIVLRVTYDDTAFLFTGDAEKKSEGLISADISSEVLKVGHHGSGTSTSDGFLRRVDPDYAVISCAADNSYGHPHAEVLALLEGYGVTILRTDQLGTIVVQSDGGSINVVDN